MENCYEHSRKKNRTIEEYHLLINRLNRIEDQVREIKNGLRKCLLHRYYHTGFSS